MTTTAPNTTLPDVDEFRARARAWLAENAERLTSGGVVNRMQSREHRIAIYDAGFGGITWPVEYGGLGLTGAHQEAFTEEAANYPDLVVGDLVTAGICAPTLLDFGSEEQKRRYIPHMLRGDEVWTQLLSEPGAGSDLAGLQTKAVLDGDEWVVNGQKVWTSGAMASEFAILIARTNPDVPKHQGLSMFIVDLKAPGVTIRPLKQMTGNDEFNEVFLDDVRLPADYLVGAKDDGWRALLRMLMHERMAIGAGTSGSRMGRDMFTTFRDLARARGVDQNEGVRAALLDVYIKEHLLSWLGQRMRDGAAQGKEPGPEGSLAKLLNAIVSQRVVERRDGDRRRERAGVGARGAGRGRARGRVPPGAHDRDRGRHERDPAQHDRRAGARPAEGAAARPRRPVPATSCRTSSTEERHTVDDYKYVAYETLDDGTIARIMLNRPESRNAQNRGLLVELDDAFLRAEADDTVRVVILGGAGPMFSSGHDMGSKESIARAHARARPAPDVPDQRRHAQGRRDADAAGVALLLREHEAVAEPAQDHDRAGPRHRLRRGPHAHVGVRPHRRRRRRALLRRRRHPPRHVRRGVLRAPVGVRSAQDQGADAHG